jgi:uncharacterized membrane protein
MLLWFFLMFFLTGLLFIGIAQPMVRRRIKPNPWYGFRTPKTLSSEDIWYAANEYCGKALTAAGAIMALAAISLVPLAFLPHMGLNAYAYGWLIAFTGSLTWAVFISFRYLQKL